MALPFETLAGGHHGARDVGRIRVSGDELTYGITV